MKNIIPLVISLAAFCWHPHASHAATPKVALLFLSPEQMTSGYSVGDLFSTSDLGGRIIDLRAEPWRSRLKGALDQPGPLATVANSEYSLVRDTSVAGGTTLPQFRLSVDLRGGMEVLLKVRLKNARTHTLSLTAVEKSYVSRFRYWTDNPNRVDGKFILTELLTADELEITQADSHSASAAAAFKAMKQSIGAANLKAASASEAAITIKGEGFAVAYKAWKVPADKPAIGAKLPPIEFQERISGGQFFELTLHQDGPNADIKDYSEYIGHAEISAQTNALFRKVGARILGPSDIAPRAHFHTLEDLPTFRLNTLSYLEGTRLKVDPFTKSDLKQWARTGGEFIIFAGDKSLGPLVEQWQFQRYRNGSINPKFCIVTLRDFIATVSLDR